MMTHPTKTKTTTIIMTTINPNVLGAIGSRVGLVNTSVVVSMMIVVGATVTVPFVIFGNTVLPFTLQKKSVQQHTYVFCTVACGIRERTQAPAVGVVHLMFASFEKQPAS